MEDFPACKKNTPATIRFVYCPGYGEPDLIASDHSNTWPYWRIFVSCIHGHPQHGFDRVEKGTTPDLNTRLQNKISVLEGLRDRGVWLMDASVVALYPKSRLRSPESTASKIIKRCWKSYASKIIRKISPDRITVIGNGARPS